LEADLCFHLVYSTTISNLIKDMMHAANNASGASQGSNAKQEPVLECNYEVNCTRLYEAIEAASTNADYARLLNYLENGRWEGYLYPNTGAPAEQAKTWVTRFDVEDEKKVKWSQLPLHLAIVCSAPFSIIKMLVNLYPKALRCTDDQHMLPLHLALRQGASDEIVAFLLKEFPDAVYAKGKNGRTPVECALRAKDKDRGSILNVFVERTKKRLSTKVIEERATLKSLVESKNTAIESFKSEIAVQQSLIYNLRNDLARERGEHETLREKQAAKESEFISKIQTLETCHTEMEEEAKEVVDKLRDEKLVETLEMQTKLEKLEAEKRNLENKHRKAQEKENCLRRELAVVIEKVSKASSPDDFIVVKQEIEAINAAHLKKGIVEAQDDIFALREELARTMDDEKSVGNKSLSSIKKSVEKLRVAEKNVKTSADLSALQKEVVFLRDELKNLSDSSQTKDELFALRKAIEIELRSSEGKTNGEIDALKKALRVANESHLQSKTAAELAAVKSDLQALKNSMAEKLLENTTKKDLDVLIESIQNAMVNADSKIKGQLSALKCKVETINAKVFDSTSKDEMISLKKDVELLKDELKAIEITAKIQEEASGLKRVVDEELQKSQGKTQQELMLIKLAIKALVDKGLENKDANELVKVKSELGAVKANLKSVEEASKTQVELAVLKKALEYQIQSSVGKTAKELTEMKKAVDAINMENKESKKLKKMLTDEIKEANNKTEKELMEIKKSLDRINVTKLEARNVEDWDVVRKELDSLKKELQEKQIVEMTAAEQELAAMKQVVEAIKAQELKSSTELTAIREEMSAMKDEMKVSTASEWKMRRAITALKNEARIEAGLPPRKDKAGLKKFLARRFSRGGGSVHSKSRNSCASSFDDSLFDDEGSIVSRNTESDSKTILPPSLSNQDLDVVKAESSNEEKENVSDLPGGISFTRTVSKTLVQESGAVEMEATSN
jgi:DNA repair exonuclease SbcCD ATPase subunit